MVYGTGHLPHGPLTNLVLVEDAQMSVLHASRLRKVSCTNPLLQACLKGCYLKHVTLVAVSQWWVSLDQNPYRALKTPKHHRG